MWMVTATWVGVKGSGVQWGWNMRRSGGPTPYVGEHRGNQISTPGNQDLPRRPQGPKRRELEDRKGTTRCVFLHTK